jgi:hypothetical protein
MILAEGSVMQLDAVSELNVHQALMALDFKSMISK